MAEARCAVELMEGGSGYRAQGREGCAGDLLGLGYVHQNQTRRCHIESRSRQPGRAAIAVANFYVAEIPRSNHRPSKFNVVRVALHSDDRPARPHTCREKAET